jgi:hypothetical protein
LKFCRKNISPSSCLDSKVVSSNQMRSHGTDCGILSLNDRLHRIVRQMLGHNWQRRGTVQISSQINCFVLCIVFCKCILCYCHRVSTQLQSTNITTYNFNSNQTPLLFLSTLSFNSCPKTAPIWRSVKLIFNRKTKSELRKTC